MTANKSQTNNESNYNEKDLLVSIIIITFKRSELLKEAIKSALSQTYHNIEVIVVDDNDLGTIESEYVKNLVSEFDGVKYVSTVHNSGQCIARDTGVSEARGDFINFLDDDDLLVNNKIELQINKFKELCDQSPKECVPSLIGGFEQYIDADGNVIGERINRINGDVFLDNLNECICQTSVPIICKKTYIEAGGSGRISACTDHYLFSRILNVNPYYDYVDDYVVKIRHYDGPRVSNGVNKIKGTIELFQHFENEFFPEMKEEDVKIVSRSVRET